MPRPSKTVTVIPPGFTVSWLSSEARPLTERVTVTLWPDASVPAAGATVSLPIRLDASVMDHLTGPPEAVKVRLPPVIGLGRIDLGVTPSVPCLGGGGAEGEEGGRAGAGRGSGEGAGAAPAGADCACPVRQRGVGACTGLGKPWGPNAGRCATLGR